ncbi:MAG: hypothetical protein HY527_19150 [Betaproteobacteria bacterium]|nr:hypothetical protein [Betaproteobacteria bacterium]
MKPKSKILGKVRELILTPEQHTKLQEFTTGQGGYQSLCARVYDSVKSRDGKLIARVYEADMERIQKAVDRPDTGGWQDLFREIMAANGS